jgi:ComF family protein
MVEAWQRADLVTDLFVPVPLHPRREAKRGYNQANLLARALGDALEVPVASRLLQRSRATVSQTKLNRKQRRENVSGAFAYTNDIPLDDMHLTLVDDVATTGATLEACADVLLAHGAECVNAFTLARAP